ncbi:MAG: helix-turn-helix domain-containing protein [Clostridiales Family XIII bacterium]|jgi:transcriptional regulator with XRE-family HTH domain|nr:helix-turn-helix domain-containing protein [Clostridiales Family XIII bacterium]
MENEITLTFQEVLGDLMAEKGLSYRDLSEALDGKLSKSMIEKYINGKSRPGIDVLTMLADYFDITTDFLLGRTAVRSRDDKLQTVCRMTGFSQSLAELFIEMDIDGYKKALHIFFDARADLPVNIQNPALRNVLTQTTEYENYIKKLKVLTDKTDSNDLISIKRASTLFSEQTDHRARFVYSGIRYMDYIADRIEGLSFGTELDNARDKVSLYLYEFGEKGQLSEKGEE